jgi:hypothetical protein
MTSVFDKKAIVGTYDLTSDVQASNELLQNSV